MSSQYTVVKQDDRAKLEKDLQERVLKSLTVEELANLKKIDPS